MLEYRVISSLEKILPETKRLAALKLDADVAARDEVYSYQIALRDNEIGRHVMRAEYDGALDVRVRIVRQVPVLNTGVPQDEDVLRHNQPGLYPDLIDELDAQNTFRLVAGVWSTLWVCIRVRSDEKAGKYPVRIKIFNADTKELVAEPVFSLEVRPFTLAKQTMHNFHWFHTDCLFAYYKVRCWSKAHWRIIENFARNAVEHGIDTLYTPLWTPPLDTAVGHARPTCQLLEISCDLATMHYDFDFSRLRRWIEMGQRLGFARFSMSHVFTQWGAKACPKIIASLRNAASSCAVDRYGKDSPFTALKRDGKKQLFGWNVASTSAEYKDFLAQLFPALLPVLREYGLGKENCFFSLSDEPKPEHLGTYEKLVRYVTPLLEEFETVEALSDLEFYNKGLIRHPYPSIHRLAEFEKVTPHTCYYYCYPVVHAPNRFITLPSRRPRSFGLLAFVHDIDGFLHWGFNFYYSQHSLKLIDPFVSVDADGAFPGGDPFLVYPGASGKPLDSIRHESFFAGLQDLRACRTLEKLAGREAVLKIINAGAEKPVSMLCFPQNDSWLPAVRRVLYDTICTAQKGGLR